MSIWFAETIDLAKINAMGAPTMPGFLGIEFTDIGDNWLRAHMPVGPRVHQPWGRLHGGGSVTLAETAASVGAMLTLDPAQKAAVGMEINANHIRPVRDGHVFAVATAEAIGRTSQVWSVRIIDEADRLICISRVTMAVIDIARA
ncbi:hotdog fold thioesterase [Novosphingobium naphthalenivorans]|uniref:hotdog fold thioesterase n=1 Tax=Novosphingobium naphthalenivorans TaxID=273168 RepID=UPI000833A211|nr:hotdog fold thioesterase [Novosphingobium naphthalenivorans]